MTVQIIRGNALNLPLEDDSVDLCVTSPPYFGLRSYTDQGSHYDGQLGSEATPAEFVDALIAATREMVRCVKPSGSIFVNLGDKYAGVHAGSGQLKGQATLSAARGLRRDHSVPMPTKSLMGIPWRYALRCIDDLGLILRAEIIWAKPNGLPESVTDRVRRSHEQWFHFTLEPRYYAAVDTIREEHSGPLKSPGGGNPAAATGPQSRNGHSQWDRTREERDATVRNSLGKLPGSVWTIPTQPLTVPASLGVDHFAAFPMEWPRRIIRGWSPSGVCTVCGQGRRPVSGTDCSECGGFRPANAVRCPECGHVREWREGRRESAVKGHAFDTPGAGVPMKSRSAMTHTRQRPAGEACGCETPTAPTRPGVVLDPFGGTGTTALVASALGRHGITVDMSADYCRLAEWRCNDPGQLAAALQVDKPEPVPEDQLSLFGDLEREPRPSGGLAYSEARGNRTCACGHRTQYAKDVCDRCGAARAQETA